MDAVTYPEKGVIEFVEKHLVPLRVSHDSKPLATDFNVKWTPTHVVCDSGGKEHHRAVGFMEPEEFIPFLLLGIARVHFDQEYYQEATTYLEKLLAGFPRSEAAPEPIYLRGVALYKSTGDPKPLKKIYEQLQSDYPASVWLKRAYPYRLL
jgi:tetratricopeptide (TPR) repeat protein